ncbi:MAG: hypothetical protein ABSA41_19710 [Terriglobia bacterium]
MAILKRIRENLCGVTTFSKVLCLVMFLPSSESPQINPLRPSVPFHCAAIGRRLMAKRQSNEVRITGSFGLWHAAVLEAGSVLRDGKAGDVNILGPATALAACAIDRSVPFELRLWRVSLRLRDKSGNLLGTVDNAAIS